MYLLWAKVLHTYVQTCALHESLTCPLLESLYVCLYPNIFYQAFQYLFPTIHLCIYMFISHLGHLDICGETLKDSSPHHLSCQDWASRFPLDYMMYIWFVWSVCYACTCTCMSCFYSKEYSHLHKILHCQPHCNLCTPSWL